MVAAKAHDYSHGTSSLNYDDIRHDGPDRPTFLRYLQKCTRQHNEERQHQCGWFMLSVRGGRESHVTDLLNSCGMNAWLPTTTERRVRQERGFKRPGQFARAIPKEELERVLVYPGFTLVQLAPSAEAWHCLHSFRHIHGIIAPSLHFDTTFPVTHRLGAALTEKMIARLREMERETFMATDLKPVAKGEELLMKEGSAFFNHTVVGTGKKAPAGKAWVSVSLFGQENEVLLSTIEFERLAKAK